MVCAQLHLAYPKSYVVYIKPTFYNYATIILPILEPSRTFSLLYDNVTTIAVAPLSHFVAIVTVTCNVISLLLNLAPIKKLEIKRKNKLLFPESLITVEKRLEQHVSRVYTFNLSVFQTS